MRRRSTAEMDELVSVAGFEKNGMEVDEWGMFTVSVARLGRPPVDRPTCMPRGRSADADHDHYALVVDRGGEWSPWQQIATTVNIDERPGRARSADGRCGNPDRHRPADPRQPVAG